MAGRLKLIRRSAFTVIALTGSILLAALLIWCAYIICTKRHVKEMRPKARIILDLLSTVLTLYWFSMTASPIVALICLPIMVNSTP